MKCRELGRRGVFSQTLCMTESVDRFHFDGEEATGTLSIGRDNSIAVNSQL